MKRVQERSLNLFQTMYHVIPSLLTSFTPTSSPEIFMDFALELYKNLPENLQLLEFYTNPDFGVKQEIDRNFDFGKDGRLFEQLMVVGSSIHNLRLATSKEIFDAFDQSSEQNDLKILNKIIEGQDLGLFDNLDVRKDKDQQNQLVFTIREYTEDSLQEIMEFVHYINKVGENKNESLKIMIMTNR